MNGVENMPNSSELQNKVFSQEVIDKVIELKQEKEELLNEPLRCGMTINGKINLTREQAVKIQNILMKGKGAMRWEINSELHSFE